MDFLQMVSWLNPDKVFILTSSTEPAKEQKHKWLSKHYPTIRMDHIIHSQGNTDKINHLRKMIVNMPKKEIVFIDDAYKTLLIVEEALPEITLLHTSTFLL